jgi:glucan phosphoethanolaminetransferase (alkaline phosphatase superfamily)
VVFNTLMDPTKIRMRYLLAILFAAIIAAAVLRHVLHVNAGFTRMEIFEGALVCVALAVFLGLALRRRRRD